MKNLHSFKRFLRLTGSAVCMCALSAKVDAQIQAPFWDTAFGTCGGYYQNGGGVASLNTNVYATYRYSGVVNMGIPGYSVSPANGGGGTSIGTAELTHALHGVWATEVQSSGGDDYIEGAGVDANLNSYAVGIISSGGGWFCGKTSPTGVLNWNLQINGGGPYASGVCVDNSGNVYVAGGYGSTINIGSNTLTYSGGGSDGFVTQLNSAGVVQWAVPLHGTGNDVTTKCALDHSGNLWVCGGYTGSPTYGIYTLPASGAYPNLFLAEMNPANGAILKVITAPNAGTNGIFNDGLPNLVIDSCNNIYIDGPFQGTATWGNFSATSAGGTPDFYVAKYSTTIGQWQWLQTGTCTGNNQPGGIAIDKNWDITTTGYFSTSETFSGHVINGSSTGSVFVAKYASGNGAFIYAQTGGGNATQTTATQSGSNIAADANRQIYVIGNYNNPGPTFITKSGSVTLPNGVSSSIFMAKLDSTPTLRIVPSPQANYCAGECYSLPYSAVYDSGNGTFRPGNLFTAQLSDLNGSFATGGLNLGSYSGISSGKISICIPDTLTPGGNYQLRITSSDPAYCSIVRCNTITINPEIKITLSAPPTICQGDSATLTASGGTTYTWSNSATTTAIVVKPAITTTYSVSVSNGTCSRDTTLTVTVSPLPNVTFTGNKAICIGDSTTIAASGGTKYLWSNSATSSAINVKPATTTTYSVSVSNGTCSRDTTFTVTVSSLPTISFTGISPICIGDSTTITASGGANYLWSTGATTSAITVKPLTNTTYSVSVSNGSCSKDSSFSVSILSPPAITLSGTTSICAGDSTLISATGGGTYTWSNGLTSSAVSLHPDSTTTYSLQVTNGCTKDTSFTITVNPGPTPGISPNQTICQGASASITASGGTSYLWNTGQTSATISVSPSITSSFTISVSNGTCSALDSTKVIVVPAPAITALGNATINKGQNTPLLVTPGSGYSYKWVPASSLSCDTCPNTLASPTVTTWYYVTVTDSEGCSTTDSLLVIVKENCGSLYLPNAFSPNDDGSNDVLYVYGDCIQSMDLIIYDRWGNKVFESNDQKIGWDGTYRGQPMNTGTYVFVLKVLDFNNNAITKKGNITLVR